MKRLGISLILMFVVIGIVSIICQGANVIGIAAIVGAVAILAIIVWESIYVTKQNAKDLEKAKKLFSLKEGEMVEVLFTPTSRKNFSMRLSLKIQKKVKTRYFALLEGDTISIVPMVGEEMLEPEKMNYPRTLYYQFTPITKEKK